MLLTNVMKKDHDCYTQAHQSRTDALRFARRQKKNNWEMIVIITPSCTPVTFPIWYIRFFTLICYFCIFNLPYLVALGSSRLYITMLISSIFFQEKSVWTETKCLPEKKAETANEAHKSAKIWKSRILFLFISFFFLLINLKFQRKH